MLSDAKRGHSFPLGATVCRGGVNFSLFSRAASRVELLFFDRADDARPSRTIALDPRSHRTYHYWHAFVPDVGAGQLYGYRVHGPFDPALGMRFDPTKVLLDPYGRGVVMPAHYSREAASQPGDNAATAMKSVVADPSAYDWEGDAPLRRPSARTIIYEMHVRGFTRPPSSGVAESKRGTFAGMIERIPYLQELGVTAVELLPVFQFDAQDCPPGRVNYWGYAPVSFFAPHQAYSSRQDALGPLDEFRDMVKALHRAGLEVILDVVYNHTAEGDGNGPTLCFRGLENRAYYILEPDRARYANYSGTGNTLNANHPVVHRFVMLLAERRARRDVEPELQRMSLARLLERANIAWHGVEVGKPDWSHHSHSLAVTAANREGGLAFHMMLNAYWEPLDFMLPAAGIDRASEWRRWIDTAQETPNDIVAWRDAPPVAGPTYRVEPRSVVALFARGR